MSVDDLIDFTPELRAEAVELIKRYKIGPLFTPPVVSKWDGPLGTLMLPSNTGGTNWPGGALDPETNILYIYSFTNVVSLGLINDACAGHGLRPRKGARSESRARDR